jgi:hypothetical protein
MIKDQDVERVVTVMRNCAKQLRWAHADLSRVEAPVDPLAKIDGVAKALEGLAEDVEAELTQAGRTVAGLTAQVSKLRNENNALSSRGIQRL